MDGKQSFSACSGCGAIEGTPHNPRCLAQVTSAIEPAHYGGAESRYEAIQVMLAWHGPDAVAWFCQLNAEKYLARVGKKISEDGDAAAARIEDLRKARWYVTAAANVLEHGKVRV